MGGYMTASAVTRTDRFRAASMGAGISNLISMMTTHDIPDFMAAHIGLEVPHLIRDCGTSSGRSRAGGDDSSSPRFRNGHPKRPDGSLNNASRSYPPRPDAASGPAPGSGE